MFTRLYERLVRSLEALGHARTAHCALNALVEAPGGAILRLPRADLAALVAELIIVIKDQPHPFFAHTDLLDFPGARTRKPQPRLNELLEAPATRRQGHRRHPV